MAKVKVRLLKPLNGSEIGSEAEYDESAVKRLVALGAIAVIESEAPKKAKAAKKTKGKAAQPPLNKMDAPPQNKVADPATSPPAGGGSPAEGE